MKYADSEQAASNRTRAFELRAAQGAVLRRHRELAGRSLADVAAAAQCSPAHLSEVERGRKDVSAERLAAVAAALEVPLHVLFADLAETLAPVSVLDARAHPGDPRAQLEQAAASLTQEGLRVVAHFGAYMASGSAPSRRRIGFTVPGREDMR